MSDLQKIENFTGIEQERFPLFFKLEQLYYREYVKVESPTTVLIVKIDLREHPGTGKCYYYSFERKPLEFTEWYWILKTRRDSNEGEYLLALAEVTAFYGRLAAALKKKVTS